MDRLRFEAFAPTFLLAVTKQEPDRMIEGATSDRNRTRQVRPVDAGRDVVIL